MSINSQETSKSRKSYGTIASIVGISTNIFLFLIKLFAGLISGSIAIIADAINNFSDAGTSTVSLVSFKLASKPADKDHPFGHARIEYVASLIVSFIILYIGLDLFIDSLRNIFDPENNSVTIEIISIALLSVSIVTKLCLALYYKNIGKKIDSQVIRAAAQDSLNDCISTGAVLISSLIIRFTSFYIIDSIIGLAVSIMIIISGIKILNETKNSILGEAPKDSVVRSIEEITAKYPEILGIHDMIVHNYGPEHYIASFHAEVDGESDIYKLHDSIDNVEREISETLGILCTIHMDPIITNNEIINELKSVVTKIVKEIDEAMSIHDFRAVIGDTHTNLIFDVVLPFDCKTAECDIKEMICSKVAEVKKDTFCVITIDRG